MIEAIVAVLFIGDVTAIVLYFFPSAQYWLITAGLRTLKRFDDHA